MIPPTATASGLHDFVAECVLTRYSRLGIRATELGAGPGAMAARLRAMGCDVITMDSDSENFAAHGDVLLSDNHVFVIQVAP